MKPISVLIGLFLVTYSNLLTQEAVAQIQDNSNLVKVLLIQDPYSDSRTGPEKLAGPSKLNNQGLMNVLDEMGCDLVKSHEIEMPPELEDQYGEWNRASLTNNVLNKTISHYDIGEVFVIGLLSGNKSVSGMLAGLQHMGPDRQPLKDSRGRDIIGLPRLGEGKPLKVGLLWIHSEAAFNTPDITLEGDMGGMNVAVAAGMCNSALRLQAGLDPPISTKHILMLGAWDTNSYEEHLLDNSFVRVFSPDVLDDGNFGFRKEFDKLTSLVDIIYVHVDLSILDRLDIEDLSDMMQEIFAQPKAAALGIASCPENPDERILDNANKIVSSAVQGLKNRK